MASQHSFAGSILDEERLELGEGPTYDPVANCLWWFDIMGRSLKQHELADGTTRSHALPFMGSVIARIDGKRHLIASDQGIFLRDSATGDLSLYAELEPASRGTRSNDGRLHPSGTLWIGTMGKTAATGAGAIYHVAGTTVTRIFDAVSIPNAICFSPDGSVVYFTDSKVNQLMRAPVDPATGLPTGPASVLVDGRDMPGVFDGSVCDADGHIWNARWDGGCLDRYDAQGNHIARYAMPARRVTCPAFFGRNADRLMVTSCWEGLDAAGREADNLAGATFQLGIEVKGRIEPAFHL